jgi:cysteine desulfurase/selenocysteine lyase
MNLAHLFPALQARPHGQRLAFLDSAASAQKPQAVLDALHAAYAGPYANIHRGLYFNSAASTAAFEAARTQLASFLGADAAGLIFTRNATEAVNLVAHTWGTTHLTPQSVVVISELEHHANIVPWQLLQARLGFTIRVWPVLPDGTLSLTALPNLLDGAQLLAITQKSNVNGYAPPLASIIPMAKAAGAVVLIDGAQGAVHAPQNLATLGADFYIGTGHKLYGPTGIGWLWGQPALLNTLPPYQGGGDMIEQVRLPLGTTFAQAPARFEAGTPAIVEAIGLGAATQFMLGLGWPAIQAHEAALAQQLSAALAELPFLTTHGPAQGQAATGTVPFSVQGCHPADVAMLLDQQGVAVRSGHHCAMPLMAALGLPHGCLRASLGVYNTLEDVTQLVAALHTTHRMLAA